jgi:hypothetical protein
MIILRNKGRKTGMYEIEWDVELFGIVARTWWLEALVGSICVVA